jgi:hypothetical protein
MIRRTLDDAQEIDAIIATAPALARRAKWIRVIENAASFTQAWKAHEVRRLLSEVENVDPVSSHFPCLRSALFAGKVPV